jgi:serine/threonine-protein kinase
VSEPVFERLSTALSATYAVQRELGGGGMSRVYLATDRELGREVVVKTLPPDLLTPDAVERFKREIRTAARLQHPNIVPLLSAGEADGVPYFTMPWVEGASLRERLQRGSIPLNEGMAILRDMARALAAAHAKGIVHRDIKPENVLLSAGAALITDFGVARALTEATHATGGAGTAFKTGTGIAVGTPAYMAPEQFAADPAVDHRADVYAWGIVAYEVLTGHHPFEGARGTELLQAHMTKTPKPVATTTPDVPSRLAAIVARALEKDPARRPASAQELVDALDMHHAPAAGDRKRQRTLYLALAAVVLLVATTALVMVRRGGGAARDARMIAVAPFRVGGASADVHYLREGLGDLMTPQLQSIPGVSAPSMRVVLGQWQRAGGSTDADLPDDRALRVAANAGAGQLVLGEIVGTAGRLTISAQLIRVSDGKVLAPAKVEGPADSAASLAARLVATLLSIRDGGTADMVRSVVSANPDAVAPFLGGEQAYRRGRYADAIKGFVSAFEHDTTFAVAALRAYIVNQWLDAGGAIPGPWLTRAWKNRERLRGVDAALVTALTGPNYPAPEAAREHERRLWSAAEATPSAELWYLAGDILFHRYTLGGDTTSWSRALQAFQRAEALDSSFAPALEHQNSIYASLGDSSHARAAYNRQRMLDSTGDFFLFNDQSFNAAFGSMDEATRAIRRYVQLSPEPVGYIAGISAADAPTGIPDDRRLMLADAFVRLRAASGKPAGVSSDPGIIIENGAYAVNIGRPVGFQSGPGRDSAVIVNLLNVLAGLTWQGDSAAAAHSASELAKWAASNRDTVANVHRSAGYLAAGLWAFSHGDTVGVERARSSLRKLRAPPESPWLLTTPMIHEKLLAAHVAVARKAADARSRLEELDSLLMDSPVNRNYVLTPGNLLVSQLWERLGDDERAWRAVSRHHMTLGLSSFSSARLRASARIAERLGKRDAAVAALRTYVATRARADAAHQADLQDARATLARLERANPGR